MGIDFGVAGIELEPGDHICAVYQDPGERDPVMAPYFRAGLLAGEHCLVALDTSDPDAALDAIGSAAEVARWQRERRLDVRTAPPPDELRRHLTFDEMIEVWDVILDMTRSSRVRLGGEASWWLRHTSKERLIRYESEMNRTITPGLAVLCLYDTTRFDPDMAIDVIQTHPKVLVGDKLVHNPDYQPPERFVAAYNGGSSRAWVPRDDAIAGLVRTWCDDSDGGNES